MANKFAIRSDQRTAVLGKTNSGKSYFVRYLTWNVPRLIVCDSKGTVTPERDKWRLEEYSDAAYRRLVRKDTAPGRLCVPRRDRQTKQIRNWRDFFNDLLEVRNCVIDIDELGQVGQAADEEVRTLFQVGRELGLGVIACAQRPAWIPLASLSEAEWYVIFQTRWEDDQERIYDLVGKAGFEELARYNMQSFAELRERQFLLYSIEQDKAKLFNQLDVTIIGGSK